MQNISLYKNSSIINHNFNLTLNISANASLKIKSHDQSLNGKILAPYIQVYWHLWSARIFGIVRFVQHTFQSRTLGFYFLQLALWLIYKHPNSSIHHVISFSAQYWDTIVDLFVLRHTLQASKLLITNVMTSIEQIYLPLIVLQKNIITSLCIFVIHRHSTVHYCHWEHG